MPEYEKISLEKVLHALETLEPKVEIDEQKIVVVGMSGGADYIATGHYARICHVNNGRYTIEKSVKVGKDQSEGDCR